MNFEFSKKEEMSMNELESQIANLKKENEKIKKENEELKQKLSEKTNDSTAELKEELKKIKKISSNSSQQRFIYPFENIESESIQSLVNIENIGNYNGSRFIKVLIDKLYILKEKNNENDKQKNIQHLLDEFEIMNMLHHPNIQKAHRIIINDEKLPPSILLEYCPLNLKKAIENKMLSKVQQVFSIYQIARAMKYIHSRKIIHQNLKPSNILISEYGIIKIGGFENSKLISSENQTNKEQLNNDIYSFGIITYFILSGYENPNETILNEFPLLAKQLIYASWLPEIECRPSFEIICDVLEKNKFNLISLSQQEIEEVTQMINEYNKQTSL